MVRCSETGTDAKMPLFKLQASSPTRNVLTLCGVIRRLLTWSAKTDAEGRQLISLVGAFLVCQQKLTPRGAS